MDRGEEPDAASVDTPRWLRVLLLFELVTIALHQLIAVWLFLRRRDKWPIRGRIVWLVAVTVIIVPLEQYIRVLREIVPGGLGCGAVFIGLYVCVLFGVASSLVRVWRVWFEYYFACAKVAAKNASMYGFPNALETDDGAPVKDDAVILMSNTLEDEVVPSSGETSRRTDTLHSTDASGLPSGRLSAYYRYQKYTTAVPMCIAAFVVWVLVVLPPVITLFVIPTPRMSHRGCELQETSVNSVFLAVTGLTVFVVVYTGYKLRKVADGHLIIREMKTLYLLLIVLAVVGLGVQSSGLPPTYLLSHLTTVIMHCMIAGFVTVPTRLSFLSDRFKRRFISSVLRKAKDNSRVSRSGSDISLGLQLVLDDPDMSVRFLEFLKSEWGVENYLFYQDVENYEKAHLLMRAQIGSSKDEALRQNSLPEEEEEVDEEEEEYEDKPSTCTGEGEANEKHFEEETGASAAPLVVEVPEATDVVDMTNSPQIPCSPRNRSPTVEPKSTAQNAEAETEAAQDTNEDGDTNFESDTVDKLRRDAYRRAALIYYTYICSDALQQANISGLEKVEIDQRLSVCFRKLPRTLFALRRLAARSGSNTTDRHEASLTLTIDESPASINVSSLKARRTFSSLEAIWDSTVDQYIPLSCLEADLSAELAPDVFTAAKRSIFILMEQDCYIRFMSARLKGGQKRVADTPAATTPAATTPTAAGSAGQRCATPPLSV